MTTPREYLTSLGQDYITFPHCAKAMGLGYQTLWARLRSMPKEEHPEKCGAFRAGGAITFTLNGAVGWCERHQAYWAAKGGF